MFQTFVISALFLVLLSGLFLSHLPASLFFLLKSTSWIWKYLKIDSIAFHDASSRFVVPMKKYTQPLKFRIFHGSKKLPS